MVIKMPVDMFSVEEKDLGKFNFELKQDSARMFCNLLRLESVMCAVLDLIEADPHSWSKRPCQTCRAVSAMIGHPFGCSKMAREGG